MAVVSLLLSQLPAVYTVGQASSWQKASTVYCDP